MIPFSLSSLLMSILFSNILLILLSFIFLNRKFMVIIGYPLLTIFLIITFLRFVFPFELPVSTNILLPEWLSIAIIFLKEPHISMGTLTFSIWHLFLFLWSLGFVIGIYRLLCAYRKMYHRIPILGTDVTKEETYASLLGQICKERRRKNQFCIYKLPNLSVPMIFGLRSSYILLPEETHEKELYYILSHETAHHFHHDQWLKLALQLLCIIYWWNPFMPLFKRQFSRVLEMRVDSYIIDSCDSKQKFNYLNCLIETSKSGNMEKATIPIALCNADTLELAQRIAVLDKKHQRRTSRFFQFFCMSVIGGLYVLSFLFIFEPHYMSPEIKEEFSNSTPMIAFPANSYLIANPDGSYDLYIDDTHIDTLTVLDEYMDDIKIYKTLEEKENE